MATHNTPAVKRVGPPVPPRPQHTHLTVTNKSTVTATPISSILKAQRESMSKTGTSNQNDIGYIGNNIVTSSSAATISGFDNSSKVTSCEELPSVKQKKPNTDRITAGRTVIYKSSSLNLTQRPDTHKKGASITPRQPLKLRKAPDVPTLKPRVTNETEKYGLSNKTIEDEINLNNTTTSINKIHVNITNNSFLQKNNNLPQEQKHPQPKEIDNNNIVIVHSSPSISEVNLNRHNPTSSTSSPSGIAVNEVRLCRTESEKVSRLEMNQLKPSQPLPKPRKIVKMPVATLDLNDETERVSNTAYLLRRSKTTLDSLTSCGNVTTINTCNAGAGSNGFLNGKTIEIKNNLKNAAERLFSEIIVSQQKQNSNAPNTIITKHEPAIQHQAVLEQELLQEQQRRREQSVNNYDRKVIVISSKPNQDSLPLDNLNSNLKITNEILTPLKTFDNETPKKKTAFHEILISEIAAMRAKSNSMENLNTSSSSKVLNEDKNSIKTSTNSQQRCDSLEYNEPDIEDLDTDNLDDIEGDDDELNKTLKNIPMNSQRKRYPSGCSSDSSPYGTERSTRIRTSDWIEVGDNGKEVTLTSCHISLEDSGLEDEERLDDVLSSGAGDSWDCVKEAENKKRCHNIKRVMSFADLPPLPTSLTGINKMLGSDSGLLSDVEPYTEMNEKIAFQNANAITANNNKGNQIRNESTTTAIDDDVENAKHDMNVLNENCSANTNERKLSDTTINPSASKTTLAAAATATAVKAATLSIEDNRLGVQLATLKKEMYGLRQLDLSLLSQLWALNDSLQEFRTMIEEQEQEDDSYPPHSPVPSSYDSVSSDGEENSNNSTKKKLTTTTQIVTKQPRLSKYNNDSNSAVDNSSQIRTDVTESGEKIDDDRLPISSYHHRQQQQYYHHQNLQQPQRPPLPTKMLDMKPLPRMRTAPPPPPPAHRKSAAPPRPT